MQGLLQLVLIVLRRSRTPRIVFSKITTIALVWVASKIATASRPTKPKRHARDGCVYLSRLSTSQERHAEFNFQHFFVACPKTCPNSLI